MKSTDIQLARRENHLINIGIAATAMNISLGYCIGSAQERPLHLRPGTLVAAVSRNPDQMDLFATGEDGRVYTDSWTAGSDWSSTSMDWSPIGGFFPPGAPIAAISRNPNQLDLFITGNDGRVYTSCWRAGSDWSGINWSPIGFFRPGATKNLEVNGCSLPL